MECLNSIKTLINQLPEYFISTFGLTRNLQKVPKEHEIECVQLWKNPEFHVNRIQKEGLQTQGDLYFLAERIRYHFPRVHLDSREVVNLVTAFELLLNLDVANINQLIRHLATTFPTINPMNSPFQAGNEPSPEACELFLRKKIKMAYQYLNETDLVYPMFTRQIANCLLYLSSSGEFSVPESDLIEITRLLRKWI